MADTIEIDISGSNNYTDLILKSDSCNISTGGSSSLPTPTPTTPTPTPTTPTTPTPVVYDTVEYKNSSTFDNSTNLLYVNFKNIGQVNAVGSTYNDKTFCALIKLTDVSNSNKSFNVDGDEYYRDPSQTQVRFDLTEPSNNAIDISGITGAEDYFFNPHHYFMIDPLASDASFLAVFNCENLDDGTWGLLLDDGLAYTDGDDAETIETSSPNTNNVYVFNKTS